MRTLLLAILFVAIQVPVRNGAMTGRILSSDGNPAENVRIAVVSVTEVPAAPDAVFGIAQSDRDGRYRLVDLPPGRYAILAGPLERPTYHPGVAEVKDASVVSVAAGTTVEVPNFKLGVRVTGRAMGTVTAIALQTLGARHFLTADNSVGSFLFSSVLAGTYIVYVDAVARGRIVVGLVDFEVTPASMTPIDPKEITGEFVKIPSGEFTKSCVASACGTNNGPPTVAVHAFEMAKRQVTQFQWELAMGGSAPPILRINSIDLRGPDLPVVGARKPDAESFCGGLTSLNDGYRYRLPTEIEYEFAARAGIDGPFASGPSASSNATHDPILWKAAYLIRPLQPNALGLYDLTMWEWIHDQLAGFYSFVLRAGASRDIAGSNNDQTVIAAFRCVREPAPAP